MKFRARFLLALALAFGLTPATACSPAHAPVAAHHGHLLGAGPSPGVHASDHIDDIGDSITLGTGWNEGDARCPAGCPWFGNIGGLADQLSARFDPPARLDQARATGGRATATGGMATTVAVVPLPSVTITSEGGAGLTAVTISGQDFISRMATRIPTYITSPIIVVELAVNDAFAIASSTETIGQFNTAYTSITSQIVAHWPNARLGCMNALVFGEHWSAGPTWGPGNLIDTQIAQVNSSISTICTAAGGVVIDQRSTLLAREVTQNPTNLAGNVEALTNGSGGNAVHPKLDCMIVPMPQAFFAAMPPS